MTPIDLDPSALALTFGAGLASVASPCVLPVVPIIVTGTAEDHRSRPALVVVGIATSFVAMGVVTRLRGVTASDLDRLDGDHGAHVTERKNTMKRMLAITAVFLGLASTAARAGEAPRRLDVGGGAPCPG